MGKGTVMYGRLSFLAGVALGAIMMVAPSPSTALGGAMDRSARQWEPMEWSLESPTYEGNPFDLVAKATFVHEDSGEKRTTGMFYAGHGSTWKFRFTGARTGTWEFTTSSEDAELDGKTGTVAVTPNPGARGFVTNFGNKWGWTGTGEAFVPQLVMYAHPSQYHDDPEKIDADIETFLVEHGFNGFHTNVFCRWFDIARERSSEIDSEDPNPDPRTFEALELLITKVHTAGGLVHIWAWGDESRAQTPVKWGKNGQADRRLQRYIAARLGPLPGWTMGYGYDLWEWVEEDDLRRWHDYVHEHLGWFHFLGGRAHKNRLTQIYEGLDYASYEQHRPDYDKYVETIEKRPEKPSFSEDRFRIRQSARYAGKDYRMEMTRRGLWHSTLAGGVANIWGRLDGREQRVGSLPYPQRGQIKTYSLFFKDRFLKDMVRANELTDGVCLKRPTGAHYVFYKEGADTVRMDLAEMTGPQRAVAVDTMKPYAEIDLGALPPNTQTWTAPYSSDWAIAVGDFTRK